MCREALLELIAGNDLARSVILWKAKSHRIGRMDLILLVFGQFLFFGKVIASYIASLFQVWFAGIDIRENAREYGGSTLRFSCLIINSVSVKSGGFNFALLR
ncbi:MAG TPA: hypothetical protein PLD20_09385 [Blastocatellia bacterium]|nr:hypothetical protein [Blastocatellia bacterium]HMX24914.1 hypothetical protein [Blastocatellia bacterium]HMY71704.1 hypothetical protein [Blastocatellia bacterium]HMZ18130.1 hypothetical protein [Blastocatellia bacterium]HNG30207.1 hypothetical protein [Blastocatellia bacterium]